MLYIVKIIMHTGEYEITWDVKAKYQFCLD